MPTYRLRNENRPPDHTDRNTDASYGDRGGEVIDRSRHLSLTMTRMFGLTVRLQVGGERQVCL